MNFLSLMAECRKTGNVDLPIMFTSTSKITFPGSGVAAMAASDNNMKVIKNRYQYQVISYDKMKTEYEAIEEEVEEIDLAIETAKNRLNETNLLKQQLEGQINVLREQINTARMNDEHYDNRLNTVQSEINMRKEQKASFEEEKKNLSEKLREASQADTVVKND